MPKRAPRILAVTLTSLAFAAAWGQTPKRDLTKSDTLYVIPYAHLDTQWRWAYPQVIREYIPNTMRRNFALFEKYPTYTFNFTGVRRYEFMKDYYPADFAKVKDYVKKGRWFPAGSSMDENDANGMSGESIIRQVLYGNKWFKKEFGVTSNEYMLPDTFGFQYGLPSLLAHCGLKGFSTQKLPWGSAVGIPFNVGVWKGPDGKGIIAALNPGSYSANVDNDLSNDSKWRKRIEDTGAKSGAFVDFHYYGTGDIGGSPEEDSVAIVEKAIKHPAGPVHVVSSKTREMFDDLTADQIAKLPVYEGDLLLSQHSAGSITSEAFMKRMNRKSELLADGAERASVAAMWLGATPYPSDRLFKAWDLVLGSQMHDMMAGTALPKGYEFIWNDEFLAQNQFSAIETNAVGAISSAMDTRGQGTSLLVYNPLAINREDVVDATINTMIDKGQTIQVYGPDGNVAPTQIVGSTPTTVHIIFLAKVPSCGFATFDARTEASAPAQGELSTDGSRAIENARFKVTVNDDGDIASVWDKQNNREALKSPARLDFQHENPANWPAWNMDWDDQKLPPQDHVHGPAKISVIENGPVRVTIQVERETRGSKFVQNISLAAGAAGDRIEVSNKIDWRTKEYALKASFPLVSENPMATYDMQVGAVQRGNNDPKKYEVPQQQWFDVSQPDGKYGVGILNESKLGSDKPSDDTIRLTLLYTPGTRGGYEDQGTQDIGRHDILYAIAPHAGDWRSDPWMAKRLNQPMRAFVVPPHPGPFGKSLSLFSCSSPNVEISAIKKAEYDNSVIVRLRELSGTQTEGVRIHALNGITSATEVDGQENKIGPAKIQNGEVVTSMTPFTLRAFALSLKPSALRATPMVNKPIPIAYDVDVASTSDKPKDGAFNDSGETMAADQLPKSLTVDGVRFDLGSTADGAKNALTASGQQVAVPGDCHRVYILAATSGTPKAISSDAMSGFRKTASFVGKWDGYIGQWDNRLWNTDLDSDFSNYGDCEGLVPGYVNPYEVAWFCNHKHDPNLGNEFYSYSYLYVVPLDVNNEFHLVNDPSIKVLAITAVRNLHDDAVPAAPMMDTLADHGGTGSPTISVAGNPNDYQTVTIEPPLYWHKGGIRVSMDDSDLSTANPYGAPFTINRPMTLRAAEVDANGKVGPVAIYNVTVKDTTPPSIVSATAVNSLGVSRIEFSEPIDMVSAARPSNYVFSSGVVVDSANVLADGRTVELTLHSPLPIGQTETVTVSGIKDLGPNENVAMNAKATLIEKGAVFMNDEEHNASVEYKPINMPVKGTDAWTINFFCKPDTMPEPLTLIAGFGRSIDGVVGSARYFANFDKGINFWICDRDVLTNVPLDVNKWQMLTATFDGKTIRLYKNGQKIAEEGDILVDDLPQVEIMPVDAWDKKRVFPGAVKGFSLWNDALPDAAIQKLWEAGNK